MTRQLCFKFIFVFGFLQFVTRVHCNNACDGGESHNTNVLERAFGNVLTTRLEEQTMATEEMFEIKMADHRDELIEMFDAKLEQQKNDFVQLLDAKMEQQMDRFIQRMDAQFCPPNWNKVSDSCILLSSENADFDTAIEKCKDQGGKLYEPQSLSHNQLVYALIEEKGQEDQPFWIGIHDKDTENSFVYQSNNQPIAFQHWGSFTDRYGGPQPNNFDGNQNCVEIRGADDIWDGPKGSWNDENCSQRKRFICEKETQ